MKSIIIKIIRKYYKGKKRSYIITYLVHLLIYIFAKVMSQSIPRKNKLIRMYKIKQ